MPKIAYVDKRFSRTSIEVIDLCDQVINNYMAAGYRLTLRQLYYQMIAQDLFPESWIDPDYNRRNGLQPETKNTVKNYKRLGDLVSNARLAGLIDWDAIEDRGRNLHTQPHWSSPADIITAARQSFRLDKWANQPYRPEVWVEKEALIGVIGNVCDRLDVPYFATKGYNSQSEQWAAAQRFGRYIRKGQTPYLIFLSDHDPSGIDMGRDNEDRISEMFRVYGLEFKRIALTTEQVEEYDPPPNPAKETDSRFAAYTVLHGDESWELDALPPDVLSDLIERAIDDITDTDAWDAVVEREDEYIESLEKLERNWGAVTQYIASLNGDHS